MNKFRFPRKGPLPFRYVFLFTFLIFILFTFQGLWLVNKGIQPTLMDIAKIETRRLATLAINDAVNKKMAEEINPGELVFIQKDENGQIAGIGWNATIVNSLLAQVTNRVQQNLKKIEEGKTAELGLAGDVEIQQDQETSGIIKRIPLGQATNNALLANLGPKIPVRLMAVGDVQSTFNKKITDYGINNTLVEISVKVTVSMQVVIPFATETATVSTNIPVDIRLIQGDVPYFYNSGDGGMTPSFSAPIKRSN